MRRSFGIRSKLIAYSLGIATLASAAVSYYLYTALSEQVQRQFTTKGQVVTAGLAHGIADWMYQSRIDQMRKLLRAAASDPDVVRAFALDAAGVIFADASDENPHRNQLFFYPEWLRLAGRSDEALVVAEGALLHIVQPVILPDGNRIGYAYLAFSLAAANRMIAQNLVDAAQVTLLVLVLCGALAFMLGRSFATPVSQMVEAANAFRTGRLETRLAFARSDELGQLGKALNDMAAAQQVAQGKVWRTLSLLEATVDSTADGILVVDGEGRVTRTNRRFAEMWRIPQELIDAGEDDALLAFVLDQLVDPDGFLAKVHALYQQPEAESEDILVFKDGRFFDHRSRPQRLGEEIIGQVWCFRDITERKRAEDRLRQAATVFDSTQEGILITDPDSRITAVNRAFSDITGYTEAEVLGATPRILKSGRHDEAFYQTLWKSLEVSGFWQGEIWNRRKNGELYPQWQTINSVRDAAGQVSHYIAVFSDISQIKHAQEKLLHLAHHDSLTGLPNRLLLRARLEHALERAHREGSQVAVLFVDLDRFKHVNDSLGHTLGDALLQKAAQRLKGLVRRADTVARLGGDEFTIVLEALQEAGDASRVAETLIRALADPFPIDGHELATSASIGIALYPRDGGSAENLLANADAAMYRAKEEGGGVYRFYTEQLTARATERVLLESQLRRAIQQDELFLHYQPQVDLASGRVIGIEALVRWQHPQQGTLSPARFIPLAEETGFIIPLGEWVLHRACAQAKTWLEAGAVFGRIAVNVAGRQIQRGDLVETVRRVLDETGLPAERLELEVTESCIMGQAESAIGMLQALRALGVRIAIDDFGTGYCSLTYLKRLPIDKLKMDQGFVRDLPNDENDAAIARAVLALGHSLQLTVIAEGVETRAQRDFLRAEGCEQAQGYLYSRPLDAEGAIAWMRNRASRDIRN